MRKKKRNKNRKEEKKKRREKANSKLSVNSHSLIQLYKFVKVCKIPRQCLHGIQVVIISSQNQVKHKVSLKQNGIACKNSQEAAKQEGWKSWPDRQINGQKDGQTDVWMDGHQYSLRSAHQHQSSKRENEDHASSQPHICRLLVHLQDPKKEFTNLEKFLDNKIWQIHTQVLVRGRIGKNTCLLVIMFQFI